MTTPPPLKQEAPTVSQHYLGFIEALRGLAALFVVAYHLAILPKPNLEIPFWAEKFIQTGGTGVTLFFIVSAFTLTYSMRLHDQEPHAERRFYLRRIFRIVPLYYAWMVLAWMRERFWLHNTPSLALVLLSATFTFNFVPGYEAGLVWASWTLGVEMVFYLLFPLVYRHINDIPKACGFFLVTLIVSNIYAQVLPPYLHLDTPDQLKYFMQASFLNQLPVFAMGMIVFYVFERFIQNKSRPKSWGVVLIAASVLGYSALLDKRLQFLVAPLYWQAIIYSLLVLGLSIFPLGLFVNRLSLFWGKLSYSLYLNHPTLVAVLTPVYRLIHNSAMPGELKFLACFLLTVVLLTIISYITYRFIEKPAMQMGSRVIKKFASNPAPPLPAEHEGA